MAKNNYQFNPETLCFEKVERQFLARLYKVILPQLLLSLILGIFMFTVVSYYVKSPVETNIIEKSNNLKLKYKLLNKQLEQTTICLGKLENRDDNVYRMIFDAKPISDAKRRAGFGGSDRYAHLKRYDNSKLLINTTRKLDILSKKMLVQSNSYKEITNLVNDKEKMAASIPAIQPIAVDDLTRFGSGFGYRIHPIYKRRKMHCGIDLSAPKGTKIYAAGDGVVFKSEAKSRGYGYHVKINHGYGYVTLYAHMSKILVKQGQKVKRGDVIGLVGNTGLSVSSHLHYEVRVNGKFVNPVNFYYNDLTEEEYKKMLEVSSTANTHVFE